MVNARSVVLIAALASTVAFAADKQPAKQMPAVRSAKPVASVEAKPVGYAIGPIPAWVEPAAEVPGLPIDKASMHYRVIDEQIRVDGRTEEQFSHVVRVVDDSAGLAIASQLEIEFNPAYQTLSMHHVDIVRDGLRLNRLDRTRVQLLQRETQLERRMYDGRQTFSLVLDDVRVGDEIDIAYSVRGANPVFEGRFARSEWMVSFRGPVAQYQVRLLTPASRKIELKPGSSDMKISSRELGSLVETIVRRQSVHAMRPDEGASVQAAIDAQLFASEYAGWPDVVRWGRSLFAEPVEQMPVIDRKAAEIKEANPTPEGRALAALDFVQKDVRYFGMELGVNSHRPASPEKVAQQRFGDCKDKVALLLALLRRMDIRGEPFLVSAGLRSKVAQALPSPLAFDHVIARVTIEDKVYWLDATRGQQSGPLVARQALLFGKGLLLAADTSGPEAQPSLLAVPRVRVDDRFLVDNFALPPTLESRMTFYGELAEGLRDAVSGGSLDVARTQFSQFYSRAYPKIRSLQQATVEEVPGQNALVLVQHFSVPDFFRFPEQRVLLAEAAAWSVTDALRVPPSETRRDPLAINLPGTYIHHVSLIARDEVFQTTSLTQGDGGNAFFALHSQVQASTHGFDALTELVLKAEEVPAADWSAHLAELRKSQRLLSYAFQIPAIPPAKFDTAKAEVNAMLDGVRTGGVRAKTKVQVEARVKVIVLGYQIESGRLPPALLAEALTERAIQYDHLGLYDVGALDLDQALLLAPDRKETINAAAVNASARGQTERVLALTSKVLQQSPKNWEALNSRVLALYMDRNFAAAKAELDTLLQDDSQWRRGYPVVMGTLIGRYMRSPSDYLGDPARAAQLPSEWPRPLIDWLNDKADVDVVMRAARAGTTSAERLCEAYFYMAERYAADGNSQLAAEYYRKSLDQGVTEFVENDMARRRLASLAAK